MAMASPLAEIVLGLQQLSSEEHDQPQLVPTVSSASGYHTCVAV